MAIDGHIFNTVDIVGIDLTRHLGTSDDCYFPNVAKFATEFLINLGTSDDCYFPNVAKFATEFVNPFLSFFLSIRVNLRNSKSSELSYTAILAVLLTFTL